MAFSIRNHGALYDQNNSFREHSGFGRLLPCLSFRVIGIPERSKRPAGVAIGFSIQVLYLGPPRRAAEWKQTPSCGGLAPGEAAQSRPSPRARAVVSPAACSRGPRRPARLPAAPVLCSRAPARGSPVRPRGRDFRAASGPQGAPA